MILRRESRRLWVSEREVWSPSSILTHDIECCKEIAIVIMVCSKDDGSQKQCSVGSEDDRPGSPESPSGTSKPKYATFITTSMRQPYQSEERVGQLLGFLSSPLVNSTIGCHPNELGAQTSRLAPYFLATEVSAPSFQEPFGWESWSEWAVDEESRWRSLIQHCRHLRYPSSTENIDAEVPTALHNILLTAHSASLARDVDHFGCTVDSRAKNTVYRISQKKNHEVLQMTSYVSHLLDRIRDENGIEARHVIDIGSGQVRSK